MKNVLNKEEIDTTVVKSVEGIDGNIDKIIDIDQSPIGRTPRSNPATYTGVFDIYMLAQMNRNYVVIRKVALALMLKVVDVKHVVEMEY